MSKTKKFLVKVNGRDYEVEVQELTNHVFENKAEKVLARQNPLREENGHISAPMPGVITKIKVKEGETVQSGQTVLILEAMKMENEIPAGKAGRLREIKVSAGQNVSAGELLFIIE